MGDTPKIGTVWATQDGTRLEVISTGKKVIGYLLLSNGVKGRMDALIWSRICAQED